MTNKTFSTAWKASSRPAKQRKYIFESPLHRRRAFLSSHLSKSLRQQYKRRAIPVKTGDKVTILRGSFSGKTGTISRTDSHKLRVYVTGIERSKRDGSKHQIPIHPSNILIEELDLKDRRRLIKEKKTQAKKQKSPASSPHLAATRQPSPAKPARSPAGPLSSNNTTTD